MIKNNISTGLLRRSGRYDITEQKKADLDALTSEVMEAQYTVDQFQAIVSSLQDKLGTFNGFLSDAEANRSYTLNNWNLVQQLLQSTLDLNSQSVHTLDQVTQADLDTKSVAGQLADVINKLIYASEVINRLGDLVLRKKALIQLISDEMVSRIGKAGTDANNAVAVTLVALKSAFASQATNIESKAALVLENQQAVNFYKLFTGKSIINFEDNASPVKPDLNGVSLHDLIWRAYVHAKNNYEEMQQACLKVTGQLNNAQMKLSKAQLQLNSLRKGLAAGTAAAFAA